jgi:copper homeostasis protein
MGILLEVIVQSIDDARAAADGGADRIEIVRSIDDGGLTPSIDLVHAIAARVNLPLRVMVRENAGYALLPGERGVLQSAARAMQDAGVDGIVLGFADAQGVRMGDVMDVLDAAQQVKVTFHRAFDTLRDPLAAIPLVAACAQVDRILTSGGTGSATERAAQLKRYSAAAGARLTIVAGGGVDDESAALFAATGCVREIHVGRAARAANEPSAAVSSAKVRALRKLLDHYG